MSEKIKNKSLWFRENLGSKIVDFGNNRGGGGS